MERIVKVLRCRRTGGFILNPMGTFRGYGAFVGVPPYRTLPAGTESDSLGRLAMEILALSGPTGAAIATAKEYMNESSDDETRSVRSRFGLDAKRNSTSILARRFLIAEVAIRDGRRSWTLIVFSCSSSPRVLRAGGSKPIRILFRAGPAALGVAIRDALKLPISKPRKMA